MMIIGFLRTTSAKIMSFTDQAGFTSGELPDFENLANDPIIIMLYIISIQVHELWDGNKAVRLHLVPIPWSN